MKITLHAILGRPPKFALDDLAKVHQCMAALLSEAGIRFEQFYYSYQHPEGIEPALRGPAPDRKPSPYFVNLAIETYDLDRSACWMIGDRDMDILCGQRANIRTIQIASPEPTMKAGKATPDFSALDLTAAVEIIARQIRQASPIR